MPLFEKGMKFPETTNFSLDLSYIREQTIPKFLSSEES